MDEEQIPQITLCYTTLTPLLENSYCGNTIVYIFPLNPTQWTSNGMGALLIFYFVNWQCPKINILSF